MKPVGPVADSSAAPTDPLDSAKNALQMVRNRGVTNYTDLMRTNKRRREEVDTDEEELDDDREHSGLELADYPPDTWQSSEDGRVWTRIHNVPRKKLYVPTMAEDVPVHRFLPGRVTDIRRGSPNPEHHRLRDEWHHPQADRKPHYVWTGTTTFIVETDHSMDDSTPTSRAADSDHDEVADDEHESYDSPGPSGPPLDSTPSSDPGAPPSGRPFSLTPAPT